VDGGVNVPPGWEAVRPGGTSNGLRPCADVVAATASTAIVAAHTFKDTDMVQDLQKAEFRGAETVMLRGHNAFRKTT
jgi:hypothetical protein